MQQRKLDTERTIVEKIAQKVTSNGIKAALPRQKSVNYVQNYVFGGSTPAGGFNGTQGGGGITADAYDETLTTVSEVVRCKLVAGTGIYFVDDPDNNQIIVHAGTV